MTRRSSHNAGAMASTSQRTLNDEPRSTQKRRPSSERPATAGRVAVPPTEQDQGCPRRAG